jgi:hypothetical protein
MNTTKKLSNINRNNDEENTIGKWRRCFLWWIMAENNNNNKKEIWHVSITNEITNEI